MYANQSKEYLTQLNGLIKDIFGAELRISELLNKAGFSPEQIAELRNVKLSDLLENIDLALQTFLIFRFGFSRRRHILYCRYGLFGTEKQTLRSIGKELGISGTRVQQIERKTVKLLKRNRFFHMVEASAYRALNIETYDEALFAMPDENTFYTVSGNQAKYPFAVTEAMRDAFLPSDVPQSLSEILRSLNELRPAGMWRLKYRNAAAMLVRCDLLEEQEREGRFMILRPTDKGREMGMTVGKRTDKHGVPYQTVYYNKNAQKLFVDILAEALPASKH